MAIDPPKICVQTPSRLSGPAADGCYVLVTAGRFCKDGRARGQMKAFAASRGSDRTAMRLPRSGAKARLLAPCNSDLIETPIACSGDHHEVFDHHWSGKPCRTGAVGHPSCVGSVDTWLGYPA